MSKKRLTREERLELIAEQAAGIEAQLRGTNKQLKRLRKLRQKLSSALAVRKRWVDELLREETLADA